MSSLADIGRGLDAASTSGPARARAASLLGAGEAIVEHWLVAHDERPTAGQREGFRLLALQRQGAHRDPTFNACRETCRELVYHFNLVAEAPAAAPMTRELEMMRFVARHLHLFVSGKLANAALGEFCCAARPLREHEA